jgi:phenylalanyl-tRNA synthetase beta chain
MKYSFKLGNYICQKAGGPNINEVLNLSDEKLLEKLNSQVGALDNLERTDAIYKGILVVEVKEVSLHPNADKLKVVKIYDNEVAVGLARDDNGYIQVVCGAPNVKVGMFVAWIPPGVTVPETFNDEEPFTLSTLKLRDQISNGMLASERELALGSDHAGILDIGKRLGSNQIIKSGDSLVSVLKLDDVIADFENKMFTHRPDCFGHLGIAREVAAIQGLKFKSPQWYLDIPEFPEGDDTKLNVSILTKNCTKYRATIIEDVKIGSSPLWMQSTFRRLGMNPINNLVDITNYMMILTAQPQHAFDLDKIKSLTGSNEAEIIIRDANDNEEITLLNGRTIKLNKDDIVIATPTKAIALAGVMGGAETEVDENTKNILLETASFRYVCRAPNQHASRYIYRCRNPLHQRPNQPGK